MRKKIKSQRRQPRDKRSLKVRGILLTLCLAAGVCAAVYAAADDSDLTYSHD